MSGAKDFIVNILGDSSGADKAFDRFEGKAKAVAAGAVAAFAAAGIGKVISNGMDIEAGQAKLTAGLGLTKAQSATAGKAAGQLFSSNYGESMEDVQDAVGSVVGSLDGMRTANASTVQAMTTKLLDLRTVFGIEVPESAAAAGALVKSGLVSNTDQAVDLMTVGLQKVPPAMREALLDSVNEYAPYLHGLGIDGKQGFAMLVAASKGGEIQLDKTGDALKEFGLQATSGSKTAAASFKAAGLGPQMHGLSNDLLAGGDKARAAFGTIVQGLRGIKDPSKQAQAAIGLFGTPLEDLGVTKIPSFLTSLSSTGDTLGKVDGAAQRVDATLSATSKNSIQTIQRGFQGWTNDLVANSGALGGVATVAGTVGPGLVGMAGGLGAVASSAVTLGPILKASAAGQWLLNSAMFASPIGLIVLGIAAVVAGIVWFVTQTKVGQQIFQAAMTGISAAIGWVVAAARTVFAWIGANWPFLLGIITGPIGIAVMFVISHWKQIQAVTTSVFNAVRGFIAGVINGIVSFVVNGVRGLVNNWVTGWNRLVAAVQSVNSRIIGFVSGLISGVVNFITTGTRNLVSLWTTGWNRIVAAVSAVNGRIASIVSGLISGVVGFIASGVSRFTALWSRGWSIITSAVSAATGRIVSAVSGAIGRVVAFFAGLAGRIRSAIGGLVGSMVSIGGNIIAGLIRGVQNAAGGVMSAVRRVISAIPEGARKLLGINSPSKVFTEIGEFVGAGLKEGLKGSQSDVVGAMKTLIDKVKEVPEKSLRGKGFTKSTLVKLLEDDTTALSRLAARRDTLAGDLKAAQDDLDDAIKTRADYRAGVTGGVNGLGAITNAKGQKDEEGNELAITATDVIGLKASTLAQSRAFLAQVGQLKTLGLNDSDYKALVDQFQSSGDTSLATALLNGGQAAVSEVNQLNTQLAATADQLGANTSSRLYKAGVDSARDLADGLKSQVVAVTGAMAVVESDVAAALARVGVNTKPLAAQTGRDIADGIAIGLADKKAALNITFDDIAKDMVTTIKKRLKIKSPSRVFRDEVGAQIPEGVRLGILAGAPGVSAAVAGLVPVLRPDASASVRPLVSSGSVGRSFDRGVSEGGFHIEHFHAGGQSPDEIAAAWSWEANWPS